MHYRKYYGNICRCTKKVVRAEVGEERSFDDESGRFVTYQVAFFHGALKKHEPCAHSALGSGAFSRSFAMACTPCFRDKM